MLCFTVFGPNRGWVCWVKVLHGLRRALVMTPMRGSPVAIYYVSAEWGRRCAKMSLERKRKAMRVWQGVGWGVLACMTAACAAQQAVDTLRVHRPSTPPQLRRDAWPAVAGPLQRDAQDGVAKAHIPVRHGVLAEAEEAGPAHPAQLHHPLDAQSLPGAHFFRDLPVDCGFPVDACNIRCSSMRCKHPFKESISTAC